VSTHPHPVLAAGAVLWRPLSEASDEASGEAAGEAAGGLAEVAVVHRPRYDDWSLPKGKVKPGEHRVVAAVREVVEETGHTVALGRHLGRTEYRVDGRGKRVEHWAARSLGGEFTANGEVDELRWLPVSDAGRLVTHRGDVAVLRRFTRLPAATSTLLLVRHAKAGSRKRFSGDDRLRPLSPEGRDQAQALVSLCLAFGATTVHSADRARCVQTVQPLADVLGTEVRNEPTLTEEGYAVDSAAGALRAQQILTAGGVPVVCSQGGVIPDLVHRWAARSGVPVPAARTRKASTWVITAVGGVVVAVDHLTDPYR